eukprot:366000-Chlamydomonas_euryale.AAC.45
MLSARGLQQPCMDPPFKLLRVPVHVALFRYYVMNCARPKERIAVALAVRVGSVAEEEDERGVAHILEHLAFNATELQCPKRVGTADAAALANKR